MEIDSNRYELNESPDGVQIVYKWSRRVAATQTIVAAALVMSLVSLLGSGNWTPIIDGVYAIVPIVLTYSAIAFWLNKTELRADVNGLSVRHGPIPWFQNHTLLPSDIAQVYVVEKKCIHVFSSGVGVEKTRTEYSLYLYALKNSGWRVRLLKVATAKAQASDPTFANHLELQINRHFGRSNATLESGWFKRVALGERVLPGASSAGKQLLKAKGFGLPTFGYSAPVVTGTLAPFVLIGGFWFLSSFIKPRIDQQRKVEQNAELDAAIADADDAKSRYHLREKRPYHFVHQDAVSVVPDIEAAIARRPTPTAR